MSEDGFVQMLLEAAGGEVADERDVDLARAAGQWVHAAGWKPDLYAGYFIPGPVVDHHVLSYRSTQRLVIKVRLSEQKIWRDSSSHIVAHVGHALDILAAEELLPARFCTIGRAFGEELAEAHSRSAAIMQELGEQQQSLTMLTQAYTLREAAASARRFAGTPLAVLA